MLDITGYLQMVGHWLVTSGVRIFVILVLVLVALRAARVISGRLFHMFPGWGQGEEAVKRSQTLSSVIRHVLAAAILAVGSIMFLDEIGIAIGPVLAAAGIVGVAVGFGAQSLVKDLIAGFFILMEDQIRVGDVVNIADKGGLVEKVNLRTTILRDLAGNVHYVPNGQISVVTNMTKEYSRYVFDVGVSYREDVDDVIEQLKAIDEEMRADPEYAEDILEPLEIMGLDRFEDSAIIVRARTTTKPIRQWRVGREFNRRLKKRLDERNIEIPFPHVTVYMGRGKQGESAPLRVESAPLRVAMGPEAAVGAGTTVGPEAAVDPEAAVGADHEKSIPAAPEKPPAA